MADLPELTEQERWLLVEYGDVEGDFPQLIYHLHFAFPGLAIWEKYRLAQELIAGVVGKGVMEVIRIEYVEDSPGRLRIVLTTPVPLDEFRRVWDHPLVWDPQRVYYAPGLLGFSEASLEMFAIAPTALGDRALAELVEAATGKGEEAEPGAAPDPAFAVGLEQARRGELLDGEEVFRTLEERIRSKADPAG